MISKKEFQDACAFLGIDKKSFILPNDLKKMIPTKAQNKRRLNLKTKKKS